MTSAFPRMTDPDGAASLFDGETPRDIAVEGDVSGTADVPPPAEAARGGLNHPRSRSRGPLLPRSSVSRRSQPAP